MDLNKLQTLELQRLIDLHNARMAAARQRVFDDTRRYEEELFATGRYEVARVTRGGTGLNSRPGDVVAMRSAGGERRVARYNAADSPTFHGRMQEFSAVREAATAEIAQFFQASKQ